MKTVIFSVYSHKTPPAKERIKTKVKTKKLNFSFSAYEVTVSGSVKSCKTPK